MLFRSSDGRERNWRIIGLTSRNTVKIETENGIHDSYEKPSEFGMGGLPPKEKAILRRGLTRSGTDRSRPRKSRGKYDYEKLDTE